MTAEETIEVYKSLTHVLEDVGLRWLVEQVAQEVALGRTTTKAVPIWGEGFTETGRPRQQRVRFVSTEPYRPEEQLGLLVDAIEQAVVGTTEMQKSVLSILELPSVKFVSEDPEIEGHGFTRSDIELRTVATRELKALCEELRRELENAY